jgi:hypothetical protein
MATNKEFYEVHSSSRNVFDFDTEDEARAFIKKQPNKFEYEIHHIEVEYRIIRKWIGFRGGLKIPT